MPYPQFLIVERLKHRNYLKELHHRPIIRIAIDGRRRVGVVAKDDHEKASKQFWELRLNGKERYGSFGSTSHLGLRIEVSPVFVFDAWSDEYWTLTQGCYVEQANFQVPSVPNEKLNPLAEAWQYLHK